MPAPGGLPWALRLLLSGLRACFPLLGPWKCQAGLGGGHGPAVGAVREPLGSWRGRCPGAPPGRGGAGGLAPSSAVRMRGLRLSAPERISSGRPPIAGERGVLNVLRLLWLLMKSLVLAI